MIGSFDNDETRIIIIGNDSTFWEDISADACEELFQVIRELLVNMKKHSDASQVIIRFNKNDMFNEISYSDNGIGISENKEEKNGGFGGKVAGSPRMIIIASPLLPSYRPNLAFSESL